MAVTGRFVLLVALGIVVAFVWPDQAAVRWWWLACLVLLALDVALAPSPRRLVVRRDRVAAVRLGGRTHSFLHVENATGRRVRLQLRDAWQPSAGAHGERVTARLLPGARMTHEVSLTPTRRGDRLADLVTLRSQGPLGLGARQRSVAAPGVARALPPFPSRRHLPMLLTQLRRMDGLAVTRQRGQGTEFDSLRDYVDGDDVRSIDRRATARRREVVVRTWRPERDRRIVVILDSGRTSAARVGDTPRLDAGMDATLLLTALATRAGDKVDVVLGDRQVHARVRTENRGDMLHEVVDAMAPLEPGLVETDWGRLVGPLTGTRRRALVVLVTPLEPAAINEGLLPIAAHLAARHRVLLASVQDPALVAATQVPTAAHAPEKAPATGAAAHGQGGVLAPQRQQRGKLGRLLRRSSPEDQQGYLAAAATAALADRDRSRDALERLGIEVLDAPPDELPLLLCRRYLDLKDRGSL